MADWTGDMEDDDTVYDNESDIVCAIHRDDKESLIPLIKSLRFRHINNRFGSREEIWKEICRADALNCATSMLDVEELGKGGDVNTLIMGGFSLLHYAAKYEAPGLVKLFLSRGARTDVRLCNPDDAMGHDGLLPLGIALECLSKDLLRRAAFSPEQSTFQLIASLCLPVFKSSLEVCKLLALSSKNVAKEAYCYAIEGKLTEFAVLLMVAREKVLVPITFSREDGDGWNGSTTLHEYLNNAIGLLIDEEFKLPVSIAEKKLAWTNGQEMVWWTTALLLEVFERAGDAIEEYLLLEHRCEQKEQVEKDVALILGEYGFTLKAGDFDFSIKNWMNSPDDVRTPIKYVETPSENLSQLEHPHLSLLQQTNFNSRDWTGDMEDDDRDSDKESDIVCAIQRDDKESLIPLIKSLYFRRRNNRFGSREEIWKEICCDDALNCATSMLDVGELGEGGDVNTPIMGGFFLLHYAAKYQAPGLVKLFLSRGARTDVRLCYPYDVMGHNGLLPLGIALDCLSKDLPRRAAFSPEQSTFQSIASLCLPVFKDSLEVCKLLALSSKNVAKEAFYYATEGKLAEFAVLLMVARKKVLVPITCSREDGDGWNGSTTLHQYLKNAIGSLVDKEFKLSGSIGQKKLARINGEKRVLRSTALLLEVFERAGDAIEEYLQLEHRFERKEQVEKAVALILGESGFTLKAGDFDFSIKNWMNSHDDVRTHIKYLETPSESLSRLVHPRLSLLQQMNFNPWLNGIIHGGGYWYSRPTLPSRKPHPFSSMKNSTNWYHVPKRIFGAHYSTSCDFQVNKQTKTIEQGLPKFLSREKLAYVSMLIKSGRKVLDSC